MVVVVDIFSNFPYRIPSHRFQFVKLLLCISIYNYKSTPPNLSLSLLNFTSFVNTPPLFPYTALTYLYSRLFALTFSLVRLYSSSIPHTIFFRCCKLPLQYTENDRHIRKEFTFQLCITILSTIHIITLMETDMT